MIPELLAPAGSIEAFLAGFHAGADAFYLGVHEFNARKRAKNFSFEELNMVTAYAHKHGKKNYLTLNTLVFDSEIPAVIDLLQFCEKIRVDAVIIQDLGMLDLIRRYFPKMPIHASTQLFCHNSLHAQFLKDHGVSRIILPRELSLEEILQIKEKVPLEYEVFIHGALCFSFSGCCLFSSTLLGKSGNRGECSQPCRFAFKCDGKMQYPFSMKDLNTTGIFGKILELNLAALKIEGRIKNAEYVKTAVSTYRNLIDTFARGNKLPSDPVHFQREREACSGYFNGGDYHSLVAKEGSGTMGENLGKVIGVFKQEIRISLKKRVKKGMKLRIQSEKGHNHFEGTLLDFYQSNLGRENILHWKIKNNLRSEFLTGDSVFCIGESRPQNINKEIRKGELRHRFVPTELEIKWNKDHFCIAAFLPDLNKTFAKEFTASFLLAQKEESRLEQQIENIFLEVDCYPFNVKRIQIALGKNQFYPLKELKKIRREFYKELNEFYEKEIGIFEMNRKQNILKEIEKIKDQSLSDLKQPKLQMNEGDWQEIDLHSPPSAKLNPKKPILLPLFVSEKRILSWKKKIHELLDAGFYKFILPTIGLIPVFEKYSGIEYFTGPFVYAYNSFSYQFILQHKIKGICLALDKNLEALGEMKNYKNMIWPVYNQVDLLATRLIIPQKQYQIKNSNFTVRTFEEYSYLELKK